MPLSNLQKGKKIGKAVLATVSRIDILSLSEVQVRDRRLIFAIDEFIRKSQSKENILGLTKISRWH